MYENFLQVNVTINDGHSAAFERIKAHANKNQSNVEVTNEDINVLLHKRPFDFM